MDSGRDEAQDVELVGDELRVGEEVAGEGAVGIGEIECDPAHVLTAGDVIERRAKDGAFFALDELHQPLVLVVDDHGDEAALIEPGIVLKEMLDADFEWPGYCLVRRRSSSCS
jgi:hypothetical protein